MSETLGRLSIVLDARLDQFDRKIAQAEARLTRGATKMQRDVKQVDTSFVALTRSVTDAARAVPLLGAALGGLSVGGLIAMAGRAVEATAQIEIMAQRAGVSTDALQALGFAATQVGLRQDDMQDGLQELTLKLGEAARGEEDAEKAFASLGVAITDAQGRIRPTSAVLTDLVAKFSEIQNPAERAAAAARIFGDDLAARMIPFLTQGSAQLRTMVERAIEFGNVADESLIAKAREASTRIAAMQTSFTNLARNLTAEVAPALTTIANLINRVVEGSQGVAPAAMLRGYQAELQDIVDQIDGPAPARGQGLSSIQLAQLSARANFLRSEIARLQPLVDQGRRNVEQRADNVLNPPPGAAPALPREESGSRGRSGATARPQQYGPTDAEARAAIEARDESVRAVNELTTGQNLQAAGMEPASGVVREYDRDMQMLTDALARGVITEEEFSSAVEASSVALNRSIEAAQQRGQQTVDVGRELGRILPTAFEDAATGGKKLSEVFSGLAEDVAKLILRMTIMVPLANSLSNVFAGGGKGGGGGLFSSIGSAVTSFFGGGSMPSSAKASGGSVMGGVDYLVGERGPEIFRAPASGTIVPNHAIGSGAITFAPSFNIDARGADSSILPRVEAIARAAAAQSLAQFSDNIRRGGPAARLVGR